MAHDHIRIHGARQHTLRGVDLEIPRRAITVFTGVSGSGKTSLVFDTIAAEAQSQLNETFSAFVRNRLPSYGRPDVDLVENLSPVVVVDQRRLGANARSTVGTITDVAPLVRLLFSRVGEPRLGESTAFSFNDPAGMCERCSGLGDVVTPDPDAFLDLDRSLADGAIRLPGFGATPGQARYWYRKYTETGPFDVDQPLRDWPAATRRLLLHGGDDLPVEGLADHFERIYLQAEGEMSARKQGVVDRFTTRARCPECGGARLNAAARGVDVDVPTGVLTAITGVAGSGKSSLADVLVEQHPGAVRLDQSGLTTSRRSSLATYTGLADGIRRRFARAHGVPASRFSANSSGACPDCGGLGVVYTDLAFLEGVSTVCATCRGRRFTDEVLALRLDGRSIADVLDLTVADALDVLEEGTTMLAALDDVGLGYLTVGQPLSTFSGGERQRLRLAIELDHRPSSGVYVLDEPTTGLHPSDVGRLIALLDRLVDTGHTIVVVEHDLDVVGRADHVIDLGPGAGAQRGRVVFTGPPGELATCEDSVTGVYLRRATAAGVAAA